MWVTENSLRLVSQQVYGDIPDDIRKSKMYSWKWKRKKYPKRMEDSPPRFLHATSNFIIRLPKEGMWRRQHWLTVLHCCKSNHLFLFVPLHSVSCRCRAAWQTWQSRVCPVPVPLCQKPGKHSAAKAKYFPRNQWDKCNHTFGSCCSATYHVCFRNYCCRDICSNMWAY